MIPWDIPSPSPSHRRDGQPTARYARWAAARARWEALRALPDDDARRAAVAAYGAALKAADDAAWLASVAAAGEAAGLDRFALAFNATAAAAMVAGSPAREVRWCDWGFRHLTPVRFYGPPGHGRWW